MAEEPCTFGKNCERRKIRLKSLEHLKKTLKKEKHVQLGLGTTEYNREWP